MKEFQISLDVDVILKLEEIAFIKGLTFDELCNTILNEHVKNKKECEMAIKQTTKKTTKSKPCK